MREQMKIDDVAKVLKKSKPSIYAMVKKGTFPPADGKLEDEKGKPSFWYADTVAEYIDSKFIKVAKAKSSSLKELFGTPVDERSHNPYAPHLDYVAPHL